MADSRKAAGAMVPPRFQAVAQATKPAAKPKVKARKPKPKVDELTVALAELEAVLEHVLQPADPDRPPLEGVERLRDLIGRVEFDERQLNP